MKPACGRPDKAPTRYRFRFGYPRGRAGFGVAEDCITSMARTGSTSAHRGHRRVPGIAANRAAEIGRPHFSQFICPLPGLRASDPARSHCRTPSSGTCSGWRVL